MHWPSNFRKKNILETLKNKNEMGDLKKSGSNSERILKIMEKLKVTKKTALT